MGARATKRVHPSARSTAIGSAARAAQSCAAATHVAASHAQTKPQSPQTSEATAPQKVQVK